MNTTISTSGWYTPQYYHVTLATGEFIAVEQFETTVIEKKINKGFGGAAQKLALTPLKVLIGNEKLPTGSTVYVRGDSQFEPWAKDVQEIGEIKALLCPISRVLFVKYAPYVGPVTYTASGNVTPEGK